ncbi:MAG: hypothetical protein KDN22_29840 [Verrucomicrobiae bacterium]|nr:hypothetical protein [Verrucomicrobiae bacterium]
MKQLSEVWRRGVVVPLTNDSANEMAQFAVSSEAEALCLPIDTDALFYEIWATNLFQDINRSCGVLIDDYEEEKLPPEALGAALTVVSNHLSKARSQVFSFLKELEKMIKEAIKLSFPVYFIL